LGLFIASQKLQELVQLQDNQGLPPAYPHHHGEASLLAGLVQPGGKLPEAASPPLTFHGKLAAPNLHHHVSLQGPGGSAYWDPLRLKPGSPEPIPYPVLKGLASLPGFASHGLAKNPAEKSLLWGWR